MWKRKPSGGPTVAWKMGLRHQIRARTGLQQKTKGAGDYHKGDERGRTKEGEGTI